jgi:hypothetical protein
VQAFKRQDANLERDALSHWQPMKITQYGCDVIKFPRASNKSCSRVLNALKSLQLLLGDASQNTITVV